MTTAHLFCRVIDNHGDLGVCWRLARQLQGEHGLDVTLLVDDLHAFTLLVPQLNPTLAVQPLDNIALRYWQPDQPVALPPADLVIEGFACTLPDNYIAAMAARTVASTWINLEYLSAEAWVEDCHGLPSVHPSTGLVKHFWFPGFTPRTGGLLREAGLTDTLDRQDHQAMRRQLDIPPEDRLISLFCYPAAAISGLLDALAHDTRPTTLLSFAGKSLQALSGWLGDTLAAGASRRLGALTLRALPLLPHQDYDRLLAACDLNLVRGEDSFVRAQWAGRAMLWHIYPQDEDAHLDKLNAWQARVLMATQTADCSMPTCWLPALRAWNGSIPSDAVDWSACLEALPAMTTAQQAWRRELLTQEDLATQLMRFHTDQVESAPDPKHPRNR